MGIIKRTLLITIILLSFASPAPCPIDREPQETRKGLGPRSHGPNARDLKALERTIYSVYKWTPDVFTVIFEVGQKAYKVTMDHKESTLTVEEMPTE